MSIFSSLVVGCACWRVQDRRYLTPWEKLNIVSATVVTSDYGYTTEFLTKKRGKRYIAVSSAMEVVEGVKPNINDIEIITLTDGENSIVRVEF